MLKAEKKDGYKDGDQMKISKQKLKHIILEELGNIGAGNENDDMSKLKPQTRTAGQTSQSVKDTTMQGQGVIDGVERGMIEQIYNFFNVLAGSENVDLQKHRMVIQTNLAKLKKLIAQQNTKTSTQGEV